MVKVITYGTYDLLHYGHIRLLERAKALGDYLIVGVTSEDFDRGRGKINVQQSLMERIAALEATGVADQIIVEEYEGQKIDDIKRYDVDIFTVGSDWEGHFDYLKEYCDVVYLERTKGVSSTELRSKDRGVSIGLVGNEEDNILSKYYKEFSYVNGAEVNAICTSNKKIKEDFDNKVDVVTSDYNEFLDSCDAVYIVSHPKYHFDQIKKALEAGKHVLCESPIALEKEKCIELFELARSKNLVLMDAIKTAYAMAYNRLILLAKSGRIGKIVSVDATCTSLSKPIDEIYNHDGIWNSICAWGPTAALPIFHILGTDYLERHMYSRFVDEEKKFDSFTKIDFVYDDAVASLKVGRGVKSEGELIVSGTKGYIYVPAPWWKTDYFEIRYEDSNQNKRYFYKLDGEGIRYELVAFLRAISSGKNDSYINENVTSEICDLIEGFYDNEAKILL